MTTFNIQISFIKVNDGLSKINLPEQFNPVHRHSLLVYLNLLNQQILPQCVQCISVQFTTVLKQCPLLHIHKTIQQRTHNRHHELLHDPRLM